MQVTVGVVTLVEEHVMPQLLQITNKIQVIYDDLYCRPMIGLVGLVGCLTACQHRKVNLFLLRAGKLALSAKDG